jgi:hypothetical protein
MTHDRSLEHLELANTFRVDAPQLCSALVSLKALRWLDLSDSRSLNVKNISALLTQLPVLEHLAINRCGLVPTVLCSKWQSEYKHISWQY